MNYTEAVNKAIICDNLLKQQIRANVSNQKFKVSKIK